MLFYDFNKDQEKEVEFSYLFKIFKRTHPHLERRTYFLKDILYSNDPQVIHIFLSLLKKKFRRYFSHKL